MKKPYYDLMRTRPDLFNDRSGSNCIQIITDRQSIISVENELNTNVGVMYTDKYITLLKDAVIFPNGKHGTYLRIIGSSDADGVVVLPVYNGKILLLNHFRHSIGKEQLEIPRGFGEQGLSPEENVRKEMLEETGVEPKRIELLGRVFADTGMIQTGVQIFYAEIENTEFHVNDDTEAIAGFVVKTKSEFREMIASGAISDGFTLEAYALAIAKNLL